MTRTRTAQQPLNAATITRHGFHRIGIGTACESTAPHTGTLYAKYVDEQTGDHLCVPHAYERAEDRRAGRA